MATEPKRNNVKRVAVLLELEDGSMMAAYAEPDPANNDADVEVRTDYPAHYIDWAVPGDRVRSVLERVDISIHVDHLHELTYLTDMPSTIGAALGVIQSAVKP